jgi:large subunit ribosomal protein L13
MVYKINATGKSVGRIATEAASMLMGKYSPTFQKHIASDVDVVIEGASKALISPSKKGEVHVKKYSGYPGGLKQTTIAQTIAKKAAPGFLADSTVVAASKTDAYPSTSSPAAAKTKRAAEQVNQFDEITNPQCHRPAPDGPAADNHKPANAGASHP